MSEHTTYYDSMTAPGRRSLSVSSANPEGPLLGVRSAGVGTIYCRISPADAYDLARRLLDAYPEPKYEVHHHPNRTIAWHVYDTNTGFYVATFADEDDARTYCERLNNA